MDAETNLDRLRDDLRHMDNSELLAYGRNFRGQPKSDEYREAKAEWQRRQRELQAAKAHHPVPSGPTSAEFSSMAVPGQYPWKRGD
jgi:hypothetical protein